MNTKARTAGGPSAAARRTSGTDAYGDENDYNDYNTGYDPGYGYPEQPRRPEFRAYNVDFEQPPRQKRRPRPQENHPEYYGGDAGTRASGQPRKKKARNDAPRRSAPRPAKKRRHPILKLLLGLLIVLGIACAALWHLCQAAGLQ